MFLTEAKVGESEGNLGKSGKKGIKKCVSCRPALEKNFALWYNNKKLCCGECNAKKKNGEYDEKELDGYAYPFEIFP